MDIRSADKIFSSTNSIDDEIFLRLKMIIALQLLLDDDNIVQRDSAFNEDLMIDSLDLIELVISIEDEFEVEIDDNAASELKTVQDVIDFVKLNGDIS